MPPIISLIPGVLACLGLMAVVLWDAHKSRKPDDFASLPEKERVEAVNALLDELRR